MILPTPVVYTCEMAELTKSGVDVLMIGSGEYTTGYVHGKASQSDKSKGGIQNIRSAHVLD